MRHLILGAFCAALMACGEASDGDAAGSPSSGGAAKADAVFVFSAIPDEKLAEQEERFDAVAKYLAGELGVNVEYKAVNDYAASVTAFTNGDIHAAWFGGLSGVKARLAVDGARAIAQGDKDPKYYSYFIAHNDTGLERSDGFPMGAEGMTFTFGSRGSTSGRLMPEFFIRENTGKAPEDFFSQVGFSGTHDGTLAAVNTGTFQVGATNYGVFDRAEPAEKANVFILWTTPYYADYNFTIRPNLDETFGEGFTKKLEAAWLAMPSNLCDESFSRDSMIPAKNADFGKIEQTARKLGLVR